VIGKDTRMSSDMLECAMAAGLCSVGADVILTGTVPTPAVAYLIGKYKADAGVMISASHNTAEFNGIKIFGGDGFKLPDALEEQIEAIVLDQVMVPKVPWAWTWARRPTRRTRSRIMSTISSLPPFIPWRG
jgi:phosphoglucosamine mutase